MASCLWTLTLALTRPSPTPSRPQWLGYGLDSGPPWILC